MKTTPTIDEINKDRYNIMDIDWFESDGEIFIAIEGEPTYKYMCPYTKEDVIHSEHFEDWDAIVERVNRHFGGDSEVKGDYVADYPLERGDYTAYALNNTDSWVYNNNLNLNN